MSTVQSPRSLEEYLASGTSHDVLNRRLSTAARAMSGRKDVSVRAVFGVRLPAPAWCEIETGAIVLEGDRAYDGANPATLNPLTPVGRARCPVMMGFVAHEAGHAAHSRNLPQIVELIEGDPALRQVYGWLDDIRMEAQQIRRRPGDRNMLRASGLRMFAREPFDVPQGTEQGRRWAAGCLVSLTVGRVAAGSLRAADVAGVAPVARPVLGNDDYDALLAILDRAVLLADDDVDGMLACMNDIVAVLGELPIANGVPVFMLIGCGGKHSDPQDGDGDDQEGSVPAEGAKGDQEASGGADGDAAGDESGADSEAAGGAGEAPGGAADAEGAGEVSDGEGDGDADGAGARLSAAIQEALEAADAAAAGHAADAMGTDLAVAGILAAARDEALAEAEQEASDRQQQQQAKGTAERVFDRPAAQYRTRPPTMKERQLSGRLARVLREAQFVDVSVTYQPSDMPPGRVVGREAMLAAAQRDRRQPITAKPYRARRVRHGEKPPLTLGTMIDNSGSMGWAQSIMASTSYALSHAMTQIANGTTAAVTFGDARVTQLTRPKMPVSTVTAFPADGGHELFRSAFEALDGALNLTMGRGARVLVVVSDGHYYDDEVYAARRAVERLTRRGGHVLWLTGAEHAGTIPVQAHKVVLDTNRPVDESVTAAITKALRDALRH